MTLHDYTVRHIEAYARLRGSVQYVTHALSCGWLNGAQAAEKLTQFDREYEAARAQIDATWHADAQADAHAVRQRLTLVTREA